jgi:hypothetical protein
MFLRRQGEARCSTPFQSPRHIRRVARRRHTHFDKSILDTYKFSRDMNQFPAHQAQKPHSNPSSEPHPISPSTKADKQNETHFLHKVEAHT